MFPLISKKFKNIPDSPEKVAMRTKGHDLITTV